MRKKNSLKNMLASMSSNIISIFIGLIAQELFLKMLGTEYLGLNGLFANIIAMLGIVELGMGSAIIYNLYKPLAENNIEQIKSLMKFYKKSYHIIGFIVLGLGLLIIPTLPIIIDFGSVTASVNIYIVYLLFLADIVLSYFISYKRSILYADQKNYYINIVHIGYIIVMNALQLFLLYVTKNYYIYLIVKVLMRFIENVVISMIANTKYSYICNNDAKKLDEKTEKDIFTKIKALFFHKIGSFIVLGTDNIIISKMLGLVTVGLYSNYYLIINSVQTIFSQAINSTTASIGNMLVTEKKDKCFSVFKRIRFINFWIATISCVAIFVVIDNFIKIWIGAKYLLSKTVLIVLVINLYQKLMRSSYSSFKDAAGIYYEDRFVPLVESIINIVVSIICCHYFGLAGVFIGTIVSGFALWFYSYPKFVYKKLFDRNYLKYFIETFGYMILFIFILIITNLVNGSITYSNLYLELIKNIFISIAIPLIILIVVFFKNDNLKYYLNIIKKSFKKND